MKTLAYIALISALILPGLAFHHYAQAQLVTNPSPKALACAYNTSPPVATSGTFIYAQCSATGTLILH